VRVLGIEGIVKHHHSWQHKGILDVFILQKVATPYSMQSYTRNNSILHLALISVCLHLGHRACRWMDLHWSQCIRCPWVAYLARNNTLMPIRDHQIIFLEPPLANTEHLGNTPIKFVCHCIGMVALLQSCHFQVLLRFTTILHVTWHLVWILAPAKATIPKLWATMARIEHPLRLSRWVTNIPVSRD